MSRNPACSFREEESWRRARGADSQHKGSGHACATWREEEEGEDALKGGGHWAGGADWCAPIILLPLAGRFLIRWLISRKLERGVGFSKVTPEEREGIPEERWPPAGHWVLRAGQWGARCQGS